MLGSFFHAERHDAQRPQRPRRAGNGQAGRFDADVVRAGRAAANPHAAALLGPAVVGRAAGDGMIEVVLAFQRLAAAASPDQSPSTSSSRVRKASALNTPPLNSTCVGPDRLAVARLPWAERNAARCRVTAVSDSNGRPIS